MPMHCKSIKWVVYIIRADDGTTYIGETNQLRKRLQQHRRGSKGCASIHAKNPASYCVLHVWGAPGYFIARCLERVVKRHVKSFGAESAIRYLVDVQSAIRSEATSTRDRRIAARRKYSFMDCERRYYKPEDSYRGFDAELDALCF